MVFRAWRSAAALLLAAVVCMAATGATAQSFYYVAGDGLPTNAGTELSPWDIATANAAVVAGDTVRLLGSGGPIVGQIAPTSEGAPGLEITYQAHGGTPPVIEPDPALPAGDAGRICIRLLKIDHVIVEGVTCDAQLDQEPNWVKLIGSSYVRIRDSSFIGRPAGFGMDFIKHNGTGRLSSFNEIDGNFIDPDYLFGDVWNETVNLGPECGHNFIHDNQILDGGHNTLSINSSFNVIRSNQLSNDAWRVVAIQPDVGELAEYNVIESNDIFGSTDSRQVVQVWSPRTIFRKNRFYQSEGRAIRIVRPNTASAPDLRDNRIYHNVFYRNGLRLVVPSGQPYIEGLGLTVNESEVLSDGNEFVNNVFFRNNLTSPVQLLVDMFDDGPNGTVIRGNSIRNEVAGEDVLEIEDGAQGTLASYEATYPTLIFANLDADPKFVAPDNPVPNFRLLGSSPLIDQGEFLTTVVVDGGATYAPDEVEVADAGFFMDGHGVTAGDTIQFDTAGVGVLRREILLIDYATNILTLDAPVTRIHGQGVALAFNGPRPDIGAYEKAPKNCGLGFELALLLSPLAALARRRRTPPPRADSRRGPSR